MKRRLRVLVATILTVTAMFASSMSVYAASFAVENTPQGKSYYCSNEHGIECYLNSDNGPAYVYVDLSNNTDDNGKIWILKEDEQPDGYHNNYFSEPGSAPYGYDKGIRVVLTRAVQKMIVSERGGDATTCAETFTIVQNDFYVNPTQKPTSDSKTESREEKHDDSEEESAPQFNEEDYVPVTLQNDTNGVDKSTAGVVSAGAYNFSAYVSPSGFAKGIAKIADKKEDNSNIAVYSVKPITINKEVLSTLTAKKVSVVYTFYYNGHLYSVTIPAGVDPAQVLDKDGYAGPLCIGKALGTTKLIK